LPFHTLDRGEASLSAIDKTAMERYRATAMKRAHEQEEATAKRRERASQIVRRAADLLRSEFGASKVILFGSLARGEFTLHSDIDLMAWGIDRHEYFVAVARLQDLSPEFKIDLIEGEHCRSTLSRAAIAEGVEL
jgi:predicted nucleotidyltransferase